MAHNIPEQKAIVFAGKSYEIGVEKNGKTYTYILYDGETILERWSGEQFKTSILWCLAFFIVKLSYPYMTTGKTITLTIQTFVGNVSAS